MTGRDELRSIDRYGRWVLLAVFVVLLGGRFTLDRLGDFPAWDLRWAGLAVVGLLWLASVTVARERTTPVRTAALAGWFTAWAVWMAVSAFWAPPDARVSGALLDLLFLVALVWAGWSVAARVHPAVLSSLWWWLYAAGWLYLAGALAAGPDVQGRYSAFGGGPNVFVRVMALGLLASLFLATTRRAHWVLLAIPPFLYGAYMSGSRGGLLALAVVVVVGGVPLLRRMSRTTVGTLVLGGAAVALVAPFVYDPAWFAFLRSRFLEQTLQQGYDSGRGDIVERSLEIFAAHPWIGAGLDGFYALQGQGTDYEYPHNLLLAGATEGGLLGLGLVVGALVAGGLVLRRLRPLDTDTLGFALAALFMLVASMFSGDYYDSRFLWFFLGVAVLAARARSRATPAPRLPAAEPVTAGASHEG
ncbi:O-antigen ligase family protein [Geodermatophilus ruber]|uniref:O-antigen ligase n=1 Tax=Geodermatophilus ruber TaxID=504800 RepID=A0A1I4DKE0_9ACTN|nr:O-antigen ligase family protein [Geodermatophilus ruber]SFK92917.1 O-antigen ligase [Geodermatophilus ruber]